MAFTQSLDRLVSAGAPAAFQFAAGQIDPAWIDEALIATRTTSIRRRKLPASAVVWIVIAMALFRDRSIAAVVSHLGLAEDRTALGGRGSVVPAAIAQARARLGDAPLRMLFEKSAQTWSHAAADSDRWHGLSVYALDGTTLAVADTPDNHAHFGRPGTSRGGPSGYPQARLVALNVPRSHLLAALEFGPYSTGEQELASRIWTKLPERSVTIVDRNFLSYALLHRLADVRLAKHWVIRAKQNTRYETVETLGPGDQRVVLTLHRKLRRADPSLPQGITVRAIAYQRPGFRPQTLLTSLLDPEQYPAQEIVALYHERWEIELGFDEKKTHMLERKESLRSKTPIGVAQELWGIGIAYNLVRLQMARAAQRARVAPRRISFVNALHAVRAFALSCWFVAPGTIPRLFDELTRDMALLLLPERRTRSNPRAMKVPIGRWPKKPAPAHARTAK